MTNAKGEDQTAAARRGGYWNNGTNSGAFYWNLNNAASNSNRNIGTHLTLGKHITMNNGAEPRPASWQNKYVSRMNRAGSSAARLCRTLGAPHKRGMFG